MKTYIKIAKDFNAWRRDIHDELDTPAPKISGIAIDHCIRGAERYEFLTSITPDQFAKLYRGSFNAEFDDLVDELMRVSGWQNEN